MRPVLGQIDIIQGYTAGTRLQQPANGTQSSRFTGTVPPNEGNDFTFFDGQGDAFRA